jgi:predicted transcriptional regulator
MVAKKNIIQIVLHEQKGFVSRILGRQSKYQANQMKLFRSCLSPEKGKILYTLKNHEINSIYQLAKHLKRDFKSVYKDIKILEKFGFLSLKKKKHTKKTTLIPELTSDSIEINISI